MVTFEDWDHALGFVKKKLARGEITHAQYDAIVREAVSKAPATVGTQSRKEAVARLLPLRHVLERVFAEHGQ